jgi:CRP/FNR family transcriptional regulator, cyclic AMP receptor protein
MLTMLIANLEQTLGYLAAALVFSAFYMRTMVPLRIVAIVSNLAFLGYGLGFALWPVAILHGLLLPLNIFRLTQIRRTLRTIATMRGTEINIQAMAQHFTPVRFSRGATVFQKGARGDSAYVVAAGEVEFPELGVRCGNGDLFGEIAIFSPEQVRTASAICATDVELYRIDEQAIQIAFYQDPAITYGLLRLVTRRLLHNYANLQDELGRLKAAVPDRA